MSLDGMAHFMALDWSSEWYGHMVIYLRHEMYRSIPFLSTHWLFPSNCKECPPTNASLKKCSQRASSTVQHYGTVIEYSSHDTWICNSLSNGACHSWEHAGVKLDDSFMSDSFIENLVSFLMLGGPNVSSWTEQSCFLSAQLSSGKSVMYATRAVSQHPILLTFSTALRHPFATCSNSPLYKNFSAALYHNDLVKHCGISVCGQINSEAVQAPMHISKTRNNTGVDLQREECRKT